MFEVEPVFTSEAGAGYCCRIIGVDIIVAPLLAGGGPVSRTDACCGALSD